MTDEQKGRKPKVTAFIPSIRVQLSTKRKGDEPFPRIYMDDGSIRDFMQWQMDNNIYPLPGSGSVGGGSYSADFYAEDAEAIQAYLIEHKLMKEPKA